MTLLIVSALSPFRRSYIHRFGLLQLPKSYVLQLGHVARVSSMIIRLTLVQTPAIITCHCYLLLVPSDSRKKIVPERKEKVLIHIDV